MTRPRMTIVSMVLSLTALGAGRVSAQSGYDLFQQALVQERSHGKLDEAIRILQSVTREFPSDRPLVARALLALGRNYERLERPEARNAYDRLVREYADQPAQVAGARARLAVLNANAQQVGQASRLLWGDLRRPLDYNDVGPASADGRYLSFAVGKEATGLAVLDLKVGKTFALANPGDAGVEGSVESTAMSPDGRYVAYLWYVWSSDVSEVRVRQLNAAGPSRTIHRNQGFTNVEAWSPDGKSIVIVREPPEDSGRVAQIAVISVSDGAVRVLRDSLRAGGVGGASFSPDGRYVTYHRREQPNAARDIFAISADGRETRVIESSGEDLHALWSPDGSHIVFLSNRTGNTSLWMMPVAGGTSAGPARLVRPNVAPFHPLGITRNGVLQYIAGSDISNVYTADLDAGLKSAGVPSMATNQYLNSNGAGTWSADGRSLAYISFAPRGALIRIRSPQTGDDREVPAQIPISGPVRWFPDGQSLLVASRDDRRESGNFAYYRLNVATGNAELLLQTASRNGVASRPALSPDGKTIVYLETPQQPMRFDLDSRRETRLAPVSQPADPAHRQSLSLAISPNGDQVAYLGAGSLVVAPIAGGEARVLVRFTDGSSPRERADGLGLAWSPDQRFLFYVRPEIRAIWRVAVAGGTPENIGVSMNRVRALSMHPDGRRISFDSVIDAPSELWALENFLPKAVVRR